MTLTYTEALKLKNFLQHECSRSNHNVEINQYPGGGIGTVTEATCGCGDTEDITDYNSW